MKNYALGIDLGGTGTKFGLVNNAGQVLCSSSIHEVGANSPVAHVSASGPRKAPPGEGVGETTTETFDNP